ncbi:hypothetical protein OSTOST_18126 [Ostertagia ostertagi]
MSYVSRLFPPYYKYAVFVFVGFQFLYLRHLTISSFDTTSAITNGFDDTCKEELLPGFEEGSPTGAIFLENGRVAGVGRGTYKYKMMVLWVVSTVGVLLCMVIVIPQFFDFNDKRGNPSHLCLVHRRLAWLLFFVMAVFVTTMCLAVLWAWHGGGAASRSFHEHFAAAEKEEVFLTELEESFDCTNDDDKEVPDEHVSVA